MSELEIRLRAIIDEAVEALREVGGEVEETMDTIEKSNRAVEKTQKSLAATSKDLVLGFNKLVSGGFSLYQQYDKIQDMSVSVHRAQLQVKSALNSVEDAQRQYNAVLEKYGPESEQAIAAAEDLRLAQERYQLAVERADMMQGNLNEVIMQSALTVIPTVISTVEGGIKVFSDLSNQLPRLASAVSSGIGAFSGLKGAVTALSGAMSFLAANPIFLVVAAIAGLVAGLIYAYQNCEWFREAVNGLVKVLGEALKGAVEMVIGGLTWLWENVFKPFGEFLEATFKAALEAVTGALEWLWKNVFEPLGNFLAATFVTNFKIMCAAWEWFNDHIVKPVRDALEWLWHNVFEPLGRFLAGVMVGHIKAVNSALDWLNRHIVKPLTDALNWLWNRILKPIADFLAGAFKKAWEIAMAPIRAFKQLIDGVASVLNAVGSAIGGAIDWLRKLCFKHATPQVEAFNRQVEESLDLVRSLQEGISGLGAGLRRVEVPTAAGAGAGGQAGHIVTVHATINVGNISSNMDLEAVTRKVSLAIADAVRRRGLR